MVGRATLLVLAAGAALSLGVLDDLRFDHGTRSLLREDRTADEAEDTLERAFGAEDILLLAWEVDDLDADAFRRISRVTRELAALDGLGEVVGLSNVPVGIGGAVRLLTEEDFGSPDLRAAVREALGKALPYRGTLFNPALDVVAVASSFRPASRDAKVGTLRAVRGIAERLAPPGGGIRVAGVTPLAQEAGEYALRDLRTIGLWALLASVAVLFVLCGSLTETVAAVVTTGLPPLYALGLASWLAIPMTALGAALFPVLAVVGITSSVHVLHAYGEAVRAGAAPAEAAAAAARRVAPPVVLSLLTTAAAFASLQATGVPAFRAGGHVVALGMVLAIPVVLVGLPACLALLRPRPRPRRGHLDAPLAAATRVVLGRPVVVTLVATALCGGGAWLASRATLEVRVLQAFRPGSDLAETYRWLEERLTAAVPVDLVLDARPDATDAEVLADLRRFTERAAALPGVDSVLGLGELVEYGRRISPVDDAGALLFLRSMLARVTSRFEDRANRRYRVKVRLKEGTPPEILDRLDEAAAGCRSGAAHLTGLYVRAVGTTRRLAADLTRGALLMTAVVLAALGLSLRSLRIALAAVVPNLLPLAVVFGGVAALGASLDVAAVAVGSVAVGLAVDDTIHLLFRLKRERASAAGGDAAWGATASAVAPALVLSTMVLVAGLSFLALSAFLPTARFGLLTAAACALALPADLIVLPAFLRLFRLL